MLEGVQGVPADLVLAGVIWALALGFAAGNYACSLVHRLPRGAGVLEKKPYCGSCGTMLATKDLFPVVSALLLRHRCRYCSAPIPKSHFWTELLIGLLFVLAYLRFGYSENFVLSVFLGSFLVVLASIENNEGYLQGKVLVAVAVCAMLIRAMNDATIYGFVQGGLFGMIAGLLVWRKQLQKVGHRYNLPAGAQLTTLGGVAVGGAGLVPFLGLFLLFWLAGQLVRRAKGASKALSLSVPFGLAVMLVVLYPQCLQWRSLAALLGW